MMNHTMAQIERGLRISLRHGVARSHDGMDFRRRGGSGAMSCRSFSTQAVASSRSIIEAPEPLRVHKVGTTNAAS